MPGEVLDRAAGGTNFRFAAPLQERLTRPLDCANADIRDDLVRLVLGRVAMVRFGAVCLALVVVCYIAAADGLVGAMIAPLCAGAIALRLSALEAASGAAACAGDLRPVFVSGLVYAGVIGVVGLACGLSGVSAVTTLGGLVVTGMAFGAAFTSSGAPLFAKAQVVLIIGPFVAATACSSDPLMLMVALQGPIWLIGIFKIVDSTHDVSARLIRAQKRNHFLAFNDPLTGLPNRARLVEALGRVAETRGAPAYLLYLDLDGFKPVNDRHGHVAGDELLRVVAARFRAVLRPDDVICRIGGDEFVVILRDLAPDEIDRVARRLIDVANEPFVIGTARVTVGLSVGGAPVALEGDPERAIAAADAMLYAAKRAGKGMAELAAP